MVLGPKVSYPKTTGMDVKRYQLLEELHVGVLVVRLSESHCDV